MSKEMIKDIYPIMKGHVPIRHAASVKCPDCLRAHDVTCTEGVICRFCGIAYVLTQTGAVNITIAQRQERVPFLVGRCPVCGAKNMARTLAFECHNCKKVAHVPIPRVATPKRKRKKFCERPKHIYTFGPSAISFQINQVTYEMWLKFSPKKVTTYSYRYGRQPAVPPMDYRRKIST